MINMGKCSNPACGKRVTAVQIEHVDIKEGFDKKYHGVSYSCPACHCVLGVQMDPVALEHDLVAAVVAAIKKK